ncbi:MAG: PTS sugar transporter subunit IIA [Spirochaetaceae bacterium]|jgi:mannitol/fructose-specific phosphotransferase system IIA component|nr:PTS sugar transporter subunit IIA [Spirochaetaceae bacterium]
MENEMLKPENIFLNQPKAEREAVIRRCGKILTGSGYVRERYVEGMLARDNSFSTAIGNYIAIPHGEKEYKDEIITAGFAILTYPEAIDWNEVKVHLVIGIAARGDEHLDILGNIVETLETEEDVKKFLAITDKRKIIDLFSGRGTL